MNLIINGALKEDKMLPPIRGLAKDLRTYFITTKRTYEKLVHPVISAGRASP